MTEINPDYDAIAQRFLEQCERIGCRTQQDIANKLDISPRTVSTLCSGTKATRPTLISSRVVITLNALGADGTYVLTGSPTPPAAQLQPAKPKPAFSVITNIGSRSTAEATSLSSEMLIQLMRQQIGQEKADLVQKILTAPDDLLLTVAAFFPDINETDQHEFRQA